MSGSAHMIFNNIHHRTIPTVENIENDFEFSSIKLILLMWLLNFDDELEMH